MNKSQVDILIIDDNQKRKNLISSSLRIQGISCELATGGFHAVHLLEERAPMAIIIIDNMSDMPGIEILSLARQIFPKQSSLPIIFAAKNAPEELVLEAFRLGVTDFMKYTSDDTGKLISKIQKLVGELRKKSKKKGS